MRVLPNRRPGRKYRFEKVQEAVNLAIKEIGVEVFAAHLTDAGRPKSVTSIRNEMTLSWSGDTSSVPKQGLDDALAAAYLSGNLTWLHAAADLVDHVLVPRAEGEPDGTLEEQSFDLLVSFTQLSSFLAEALQDGEITATEHNTGLGLIKALEPRIAAYIRRGD